MNRTFFHPHPSDMEAQKQLLVSKLLLAIRKTTTPPKSLTSCYPRTETPQFT
ncbi:hypothetical protein GBAR_LOCUS11808 [Geodia barretti]|uniref:Uncharacterized protein n=1 Tax=Geodia barretti TaxID=519541 RepID=A0AA35RZZ0_GEOBA|nr:hypothetical protein GBAR_LOCUS11808 [Geodia barretti]